MCSSKKLFGGLAAGWQAVCNPLSGKLACRMTVDLSIIDTGKSDKPNAGEIGNWEKKNSGVYKRQFFLKSFVGQ